MADQHFKALSSCLVIASLVVIVAAQNSGPEKCKFIVVTQRPQPIYERNTMSFI